MNFLRLTSKSAVFLQETRDNGILLTWRKSYDFDCVTRIGVCSIYMSNITSDKQPRILKLQSNIIQPGPFNPTNELCSLLVESSSTVAIAANERGFHFHLYIYHKMFNLSSF